MQVYDLIYLYKTVTIYIHLNIHPLLLVPPHHLRLLSAKLFIWPYAFTSVVLSSEISRMITKAFISRDARSHTDDTDARACMSLRCRSFEVLKTFRAANEKTSIGQSIPATIATSATLF